MVAVTIFGAAMSLVFVLLYKGFGAVSSINARRDTEVGLSKAYFWLKRDLEMANADQIGHKRVALPGGGDAVWFLSAIDPNNDDPDDSFVRLSETGAPVWRCHIIYYLVKPSDYPAVSRGLTPAIDPDPLEDLYAPHKFLIRKVIDAPGDPETLLSDTEIDSYITAPRDYGLEPFRTETNVLNYKLVADRMLGFRVDVDRSTVKLDLSSFRLVDEGKIPLLGQVSLKDYPERLVRKAMVIMRN